MIGAFYNNANQNNPEALERNRGENGELSQEQQEMADKWATAMTPETEAEPSTAANSATPTEALSEQPTTETQSSSTIQHFSEGEPEDSNFNPLPPEEQLAADAKAAAVANANKLAEGKGDRNDSNN